MGSAAVGNELRIGCQDRVPGTKAGKAVCQSYRLRMAAFSKMSAIDVGYARLDISFLNQTGRQPPTTDRSQGRREESPLPNNGQMAAETH